MLLITSFRSQRWIIPKGNVDGETPPHVAAAKEAEEEAGVRGRIGEQPIGHFCYDKLRDGEFHLLEVDVYPLDVREELPQWPEMDIRARRWLLIEEAADLVEEPDLATIMRCFQPGKSQ